MKRFLSVLTLLALTAAVTACAGVSMDEQSSSLSAPVQSALGDAATEAETQAVSIIFPAYDEANLQQVPAVDQANSATKFQVEMALPAGWTVSQTPPGDVVSVPGDFYTPLSVCSGDEPIGYIGFNVFEPLGGDIPQEEYYKAVYPGLRLSSFFHWDPYTAVATTDTAETGVAEIWYLDPNEIDKHPGAAPDVPQLETYGVLSYDKQLRVYIGIAFLPGALDRAQAEAIAESVSLSALE
ncbi:hypothetical protein [Anaerotruncus colihominis]|uniref:hypothetical protein n=1 Tax=Anaerotruncus colihominis TaxID=169435 RepID=UPI0026E9DF51|nr:hypothetical protein [Anaerotruncus colihominis]